MTVLAALKGKEGYAENDLKQLLMSCVNIIPSISNIKQYAKIVANSHKARKLKELGSNLALDFIDPETAEETAKKMLDELYDIVATQKRKKLEDIGQVGIALFDIYCQKDNSRENRCETGFKKVDRILKGMSAGNLIILAARPKVGKTAFALSVAENVAKPGKTVAFFSQEMESTELYERLLSKRAAISMNTLIDKRFNDKTRPEKVRADEISLIAETVDKIYQLPIKINDAPSLTVNDIRLECRLLKNLGLIVIDYLQLMHSGRRHDNRNQEVGSICRDLKNLASELGVPILCLSQLNRENDETKRPAPNDLRDSGEIEQSCNKLILMWCVEKNQNEQGQVKSKTVGVDIALNRRGATGVVLMNFNGSYMQFRELDKIYEEPKQNYTNWRNKSN